MDEICKLDCKIAILQIDANLDQSGDLRARFHLVD